MKKCGDEGEEEEYRNETKRQHRTDVEHSHRETKHMDIFLSKLRAYRIYGDANASNK